MIFEFEKMKSTVNEIGQLMGNRHRKEDISRLLSLVSRLQWQLGSLVSDVAEETRSQTELKKP